MHPAASGGVYNPWRMFLIDIPIYLSASLPAAVFYICAQRALYPKDWLKEILLMPMVIALGIGLAINNARAVIEAILGHQSEFTRTPKYGIQSKTQSWRGARYIPLKSILPFVELGFAAYFLYLLRFAIDEEQWLNAGFLALFEVGFSYVALCSLAQWVPALRFPGRDTGTPLPA